VCAAESGAQNWLLRAQDALSRVRFAAEAQTSGSVERVADGVARISGLADVALDETVRFASGATGYVRTLDADCAIVERAAVSEPLETGVLIVDALFAIGRGQRELIIGDRATGKTSLAVDAIVNQRESDMICVYVAVGQRATAAQRVIDAVRLRGAALRVRGGAIVGYAWHAMDRTVRRLLGRRVFPRPWPACARRHRRSFEALTALPIAQTEAGNLAAYIPTNLISITDGQLVLDAALFAANQRPAVNVGLSVSRVGGKAQAQALRQVAGRLRIEYAQFLELEMFARFGGLTDTRVSAQIARGERIRALLAQPRFSPLGVAQQIALLGALAEGEFDALPAHAIAQIRERIAQVGVQASGNRSDGESLASVAALRERVRECISRGVTASEGAR